jgi:hypothetical protein
MVFKALFRYWLMVTMLAQAGIVTQMQRTRHLMATSFMETSYLKQYL